MVEFLGDFGRFVGWQIFLGGFLDGNFLMECFAKGGTWVALVNG
jgi:hypothetical protein